MISFVRGSVAGTDSDSVILENHGIGYRINAVSRTISRAAAGQEMKLYTHFHVREDAMALFGFESREELSVFRLLIGISGIGPKVAMSVLSALTVEELYFAVFSDDAKTIARTPGIGPKGARRIIMELKDKLRMEDVVSVFGAEDAAVDPAVVAEGNSDQMADTVEALVALGYSNGDAFRAVRKVEGAREMDSGQLLKAALQIISNGV